MKDRTVWAARLVILVAFLDLFIQFPVVAPYARELGASASLAGLIVAAYSATNLVGNLIAGLILDRWGRKLPVLWGLVATAAALGAYSLVQTPEQLLAVRALHGLAAAVLTPGAFAMLGDAAPAGRRARVMGTSGAVIAMAAIIGPPLAGLLRDRIGVGAVFLGGAVLLVVAAGVFGRFAREPEAPGTRVHRAPGPAVANYLELWARPLLVSAYLAALALTVGLGTLVTHLPLALVARGEPASRTGLAFAVFAVVAILGMAGPLARLGDRVGRIRPIAGGLVLIALGMTALGTAEDAAGVASGMAMFGFGFGLLFPSAAALVADATRRDERGAAFGVFYAVYSLGVVIGSIVSGWMGDRLGPLSGMPFLAGAALALLAVPALLLLGRRVSVSVEASPAP